MTDKKETVQPMTDDELWRRFGVRPVVASSHVADTDPKNCPACQQRVSADVPGVYESLTLIATALREVAESQRKLLAALGSSSDSRSSIEVKTSTRGVDVACKSYAQSDISGLVTPAVDAYFATLAEVQRRLNGEVQA